MAYNEYELIFGFWDLGFLAWSYMYDLHLTVVLSRGTIDLGGHLLIPYQPTSQQPQM